MLLPNFENAEIPEDKIVNYLLSESHPSGRYKAEFFKIFGFNKNSWHVFKKALLNHIQENNVIESSRTPFGVRYVVEGPMNAPDGRFPRIRSVWFIEYNAENPKLVTAYPS